MGYRKNRGTELLKEIVNSAEEILPEEKDIQVLEEIKTLEELQIKEHNELLQIQELVSNRKKNNVPKAQTKKIVRKKREDVKCVIDTGIKGTTIEVREFRAIVKKQGLQINVVLNGIIAEWNHTNYNL